MKAKSNYLIAVILLSILPLCVSNAQKNNDNDSLSVLKKKITELEIKTKLQQEKIKELEGMVGELNKKKPFAVFPSDPKKLKWPNNAYPFEFNGNRYYFVPLIGKTITDFESLEKTKNESK